MGKQGSVLKRVTDVFISLMLLIITLPVTLVAAFFIKLESEGPVLFIHERTGLNGNGFIMIKFRGMINNALCYGPDLTQKNDPRITKVGKILRRTSIDEIPNFLNVLLGDMSIVGPRPEMPTITKHYSEVEREIFKFKPGITGISQVNGRQLLTPGERVRMEVSYYNNANFWSDLKIIFKTIKVVFTNEGNL